MQELKSSTDFSALLVHISSDAFLKNLASSQKILWALHNQIQFSDSKNRGVIILE